MRVRHWEPAPPDTVFALGAFDALVGTQAPLTFRGVSFGVATVVEVTVDDDGRGVTWTIDADPPPPPDAVLRAFANTVKEQPDGPSQP